MAKHNGIIPIKGTVGNMGFPDTRDGLIVRKKSNFDGNGINQKIYGIEDIVNLVLERMKKLAESGCNGTEHLKDTLSEQANTRSFNQTN